MLYKHGCAHNRTAAGVPKRSNQYVYETSINRTKPESFELKKLEASNSLSKFNDYLMLRCLITIFSSLMRQNCLNINI